jgi:hypothetical protein
MGAMVVKLRGRVDAEPLVSALARLQQRHPKLRARLLDAGGGERRFVVADPAPPIPLEFERATGDVPDWKDAIQRRFTRKIDVAAGPLLRAVVLRGASGDSACLALLAHHAIFDGLSLLHATDDLLRYYKEAEGSGRPEPVASLPFVSCARARSTGSLLARAAVLARLFKLRRAQARKRWTALPPRDGAPSGPQWDLTVFSVEETVALVRRCREEKTSLDGALFAAAASALRVCLADAAPRFRFRSPIEIRGQLDGPAGPVGPGDLGCFVGVFDQIYALDPAASFWSLARRLRHDVRAFIAAGGPALLYNLARFVKPPAAPGRRLRATLHSSVIGVAPLEKRYGSLGVEECAQVYKNEVGGASINLVAIVLQFRLNLTVHAAGLHEGFWDRFRAEMARQLRGAVAEGAS